MVKFSAFASIGPLEKNEKLFKIKHWGLLLRFILVLDFLFKYANM